MSLNFELLEQSFAQVAPNAEAFAASFYSTLFTDYPAAQPLFAHTDMVVQLQKLLKSLVFVMENLHNSDTLATALRGLGTRHVQYGALPDHYPLMGVSLLKAFAAYLGDDWTPNVQQARIDAYDAITTLMLEGADYPPEAVQLT